VRFDDGRKALHKKDAARKLSFLTPNRLNFLDKKFDGNDVLAFYRQKQQMRSPTKTMTKKRRHRKCQ